MTLLLGALTIGMILALLALGVYVSFKIFSFADITVDGSFALGGAVAASLIVRGHGCDPFLATLLATVAGGVAGAVTGVLHTKFGINRLLSGILVMTALYSVNLRIMDRSNIPLLSFDTLSSRVESLAVRLAGGATSCQLWRWKLDFGDLGLFLGASLALVVVAVLLHLFFRTKLGVAMRATGDNPTMITALGVDTSVMIIVGVALSNGLVAFSGALFAQYQGFADVQMGIGMVVIGLASVIIGESLVGKGSGPGLTLLGAVMGSVLFRLLVAIALVWGLNPNDLKLVTAVFVFAALVAPGALGKLGLGKRRAEHA